MVDIGAAEGYFSIRLAEDLHAYPTMLENKRTIQPIVDAQRSSRLSLTLGKFTVKSLNELPRFDAALCLSVFHHFEDWQAAMQTVFSNVEVAIVELPADGESSTKRSDEAAAMLEALAGFGATEIGSTHGYGQGAARSLYVIG